MRVKCLVVEKVLSLFLGVWSNLRDALGGSRACDGEMRRMQGAARPM